MTDDPDEVERARKVLAEAEAERERILEAERARNRELAAREQAAVDEESS